MSAFRYTCSRLASAVVILAAGASLDAQRTVGQPLPGQGAPPGGKTPAYPPGPAPQSVHVLPGSPIAHALVWDRLPAISGYRVFKSINGQWYALTPQAILAETWTDKALVGPGQVYRVTASYTDGRQGDTDFTYTNPPQPQEPTGFKVQQAGKGVVTLAWQPVPYAAWYRVFGTGQPIDGTIVNDTSTTFSNLPDGNYTWSVSADYGGVYGGGPKASITLSSTARYRVVANGFRVVGQTGEINGMWKDGMNDEVYAGFAMFHVGRPQGQLLDKDLRRTQLHGDVYNVPARTQAGTASLSGGLRTGDVFPLVGDPSQRAGQPLSDVSFPFLVWDGFLTDAQDAVIVLPSMWESDFADQVSTNWFLSEASLLPQIWSDPMVQQAVNGKAISLITPPTWTYFPFQPFGRMDHPLGSNFDQPQGSAGLGEIGRSLPRRAIVLTREMIEAALSGGASGIVTIPLADSGPQPSPVPFGSYILYVQVERVP